MTLGLTLVGGSFAADRPVHRRASATVHTIVIDKMQYGPVPGDIHAGDVVEWINRDIFEHTATAHDGAFDVDLKPGATARITVKAGTFAFACRFHPGMTGTLIVR